LNEKVTNCMQCIAFLIKLLKICICIDDVMFFSCYIHAITLAPSFSELLIAAFSTCSKLHLFSLILEGRDTIIVFMPYRISARISLNSILIMRTKLFQF